MQSRITIELDFDSKDPYIKIVEHHDSQDVRDKLLTHFRQLLGHTSSWFKIMAIRQNNGAEGPQTTFRIDPVKPADLSTEADEMKRIAVNGI